MIRALFWLVAVFAAAVALAGRVAEGYVLVVYPPWRVEASMLLALIVLAACFVLGYATLRLLNHTFALPAQVRAFRVRRKREHAQVALASALQCYF
jgi:HemY protein